MSAKAPGERSGGFATDGERCAYQRGYQAGAHRWPAHKPPVPPQSVVAALMSALRLLRDSVDAEMATFPEDDELALRLYARVDEADEALRLVSSWLRSDEEIVGHA